MNILATEFNLQHNALEIYLAGCKGPHCQGCHNPESWDFGNGTPWQEAFHKIQWNLETFSSLIREVWILGGEPLDQDLTELTAMLSRLWQDPIRPIMLWTRYDREDAPAEVTQFCSWIKTGRYIQGLQTDDNIQRGIKLASSNQRIWFVDN